MEGKMYEFSGKTNDRNGNLHTYIQFELINNKDELDRNYYKIYIKQYCDSRLIKEESFPSEMLVIQELETKDVSNQ